LANVSFNPNERSISEFMKAICQHDKVLTATRQSNELTVEICLKVRTRMRVLMTNLYCVGEADVREFLDNHPSIDVVVTLSAWNLVSLDATLYGRQRTKGVFTWKAFFGALNYEKYWLYEDLPDGLDGEKLVAERKRRAIDWN
jgi:hypothetical protein